ncbi:MAG: GNAT family N-acetyltransferase [Chloroflexota bacterium]
MSTTPVLNDLVTLFDAPQIPGLNFRHFRGESDYPNILAIINGSKKADAIERSDTLEDIANGYAHLENCDPFQDLLFAEVNGQAVAYNRVFWGKQEDGVRTYTCFGFMLPEWRRKGIGTAMLRHGERRLREIAAEHPQDGPRYFQAFFVNETEKGTLAMLEKAGYTPIRYGFSMVRDLSEPLPDAPMPEGLEVRPAQKEHLRAIFDADMESFRDHWGFTPPTEERYQGWINQPDFDPSLFKIAWDGDQVVSGVQNFIDKEENAEYNRKRGYTEGIFTRRSWRKRGLAKSLLVQSMKMFKEMGMTETALGVDAENPNGALQLYQSVGYCQVKQGITLRKPME